MKAVLLAAGDGGRLGHHTASTPKPLVPLHGRPIVDYTLESLREAGVSEVLVVTGYREVQVRAALGRLPHRGMAISFVSNYRYDGRPSLSLRCARAFTEDEPFLLVMSDHLLSARLLRKLVSEGRLAGPGISLVAADSATRDAVYTDEATKVATDAEGFVTAIGKQIAGWSALDTGAFYLAPAAWAGVDAVPEDCELSTIFGELARHRALMTADVSGAFWYDIDTADDLAAAGELLADLAPVG